MNSARNFTSDGGCLVTLLYRIGRFVTLAVKIDRFEKSAQATHRKNLMTETVTQPRYTLKNRLQREKIAVQERA